jgi:hypothetical protein
MPELNPKISPFDVARPKLLQKSSIASAQDFNVIIEQSKINRKETLNPVPKTEDVNKKFSDAKKVEQSQMEVAKNRKQETSSQYFVGMSAPYPRANNFLHNKRTGDGTTNFGD